MLRIVLDAGVVQLTDTATGAVLAEPAVVAVDRRAGLPFRAGWAALDQPDVTWPFEHLELAHLDPDPEPRRCLLAFLVRSALDARPWWDRVLTPAVTLVVPANLSAAAAQVLRSDAVLAGAARHVRIEQQHSAGRAAVRPFPAD